jgi:hypothetical protein
MPKNEKQSSSNRSGDGSAEPKAAVQSAVEDVRSAVGEASGAIGEAASGASEAVNDLATEAKTIASEAGDRARDFVDENKGRAAEQISGITSAIGKAADELEAHGQGQFAKYTRDLASGLEGFSRDLNQKGVDELMGSVGQFARSQPAAFLGAAALLGFVSSRFAMSTAKPQPSANMSSAAGTARGSDGMADGSATYLSTTNGSERADSTYAGGR